MRSLPRARHVLLVELLSLVLFAEIERREYERVGREREKKKRHGGKKSKTMKIFAGVTWKLEWNERQRNDRSNPNDPSNVNFRLPRWFYFFELVTHAPSTVVRRRNSRGDATGHNFNRPLHQYSPAKGRTNFPIQLIFCSVGRFELNLFRRSSISRLRSRVVTFNRESLLVSSLDRWKIRIAKIRSCRDCGHYRRTYHQNYHGLRE